MLRHWVLTLTRGDMNINESSHQEEKEPEILCGLAHLREKLLDAPQSTEFSHYNTDTQRRRISFAAIPVSLYPKKCPLCGGEKDRHSRICKVCYHKKRETPITLKCSFCGKLYTRPEYWVRKGLRKGEKDCYCSSKCCWAHNAIKNHRKCIICGKPTPKKQWNIVPKDCRESRRVKT